MKVNIFLMYIGLSADGKVYRKWTANEIEHLVTYKKAGQESPFFRDFLLLGLRSGHGGDVAPGFSTPGTKEDWIAWRHDLFHSGYNLDAFKTIILSNPDYFINAPIHVWISLPYPDIQAKNYGNIMGYPLLFRKNADRLFALKWWIDSFIKDWLLFQQQNSIGRFIALKGFYWPREAMTFKDRFLLPALIRHIRSFNLETLWIPYYDGLKCLPLQNPGFDRLIIQPGYWQKQHLNWIRLSKVAKMSNRYKCGMEIEFDSSVLFGDKRANEVAIDYLNRGLKQYDGYLENDLAYYTGYKTLIELYKNNDPLYDYVYHYVTKKYQKIDYQSIPY